ncbi:MAG: chaperone NapD [Mariprofundus sp.]|nr:chaperone NapD [Mariprofundus sp.]
MCNKVQDEELVGCIVGAVMQLKENRSEDVRQLLAGYAAVEIHAEDEQSRLVITMEAASSKAVLRLTESIQNLDGVLSVTPVYQHDEAYKNEQQSKHEAESGGWKWR